MNMERARMSGLFQEERSLLLLITPFSSEIIQLILDYHEKILEGKFDRKTSLHPNHPTSVAVGGNIIAICEYNANRVQILNSHDLSVQRIIGRGGSGSSNQHFNTPYGITISGNEIYVSDSGNHRVQVFNYENGVYNRTIGGVYGSQPGALSNPSNSVIMDDEIFILECGNHRISVWNRLNCSYKRCFGKKGSGDDSFSFHWPASLYLKNGLLFVSDFGNNVIKVFNPSSGVLIKKIGGGDVLDHPKGIVVSENYVYVCDNKNRVLVFNLQSGEMIKSWGAFGTSDGEFRFPCGMAFSVDGSKLIVTDHNNHRVQWFR